MSENRDHGMNAEECAHILRSWAKAYREAPIELRFPCDPECNFFPYDLERAAAELDELRSRLPAEMPGCKIIFKGCEHGHGRLTATNWVDGGCPWCELGRLREIIRELVDAFDGGNLVMGSPQFGDPEAGIPLHPWHEEWLYHARSAL